MPQDTFDPLAAPFNAIVRITEIFDGQTWQGSGVLVSPDEVLTAGHVAYRTGSAAPADIQISESATNSTAMVAGAVAHTGPVVVNYPTLNLSDVADDYALIHLSMPIVGAATMRVVTGGSSETAHIDGFPVADGATMVGDTQTVSAMPGFAGVYHMASDSGLLSPGISGAPVWMMDANGQPDVIGVMSAENSAGNYAVQFSQVEADQINAWIAQDDYVAPQVDAVPTPAPVLVSQPVPAPVAACPRPLAPVPALPAPVADTPAPSPLPPGSAPPLITPANAAPDPELAFIAAQYASDTSGHTASVVRLYHAALGRLPDLGGMQFWVNDLNEGFPLTLLADGFQNAPEFISWIGGTNIPNADFVSHIYERVLGREPEQGGYQFWTQNLDSGASTRSQTLALISESAENKAITEGMFELTS